LSHAGNFLQMLNDERPDPELEKIFDICLHSLITFDDLAIGFVW